MVKRAFRAFSATAVAAAVLFLLIANFSATESRYECRGSISGEGTASPTLVFIKLETYRWWVNLWSDSEGVFRYEIPGQTVGHFSDVSSVGDQLQIWELEKRSIAGNFSTLSNALALKVPGGSFDGTCKRIEA